MSERRASPLAEYILRQEKQQQVERVALKSSPEKQKELHDKIVSGEIDIGPKPDHTIADPNVDLRPKYDGEEAWLIYKASRNGGNISIGDLPKLRRLLDESS